MCSRAAVWKKVYQPDRDEIVLQTRGQGGARRLLVSTAAGAPRVHFIDVARENPAAPPMFCMLLRKHVQGGKNCGSRTAGCGTDADYRTGYDRRNGGGLQKHLICELMGKHSNVILCGEDNRIIDAMRRVDGDLSGKRQVLPGLFYRLPPAQEKHDPFALSGVGLSASLQSADGEMGLDRYLLSQLLGFSPLLCRELSYRATGDTAKPVGKLTAEEQLRLAQVFEDLKSYLTEKRWKPFLLTKTEDHAVFDFSFLPITQYEGLMTVSQEQSFSDLLAAFFEKKMGKRSAWRGARPICIRPSSTRATAWQESWLRSKRSWTRRKTANSINGWAT